MGIVRNNIYSYEVRPIPVYQFLIRISDQKFFFVFASQNTDTLTYRQTKNDTRFAQNSR